MKRVFFLAIAATLLLAGCDDSKNPTIDVNAKNVKIEFTAITENGEGQPQNSTLKSETGSTFKVKRIVDIDEISTDEIAEYLERIKDVTVDNSQLEITLDPPGNFSVTNLIISATGIQDELKIPSYTIGGEFQPPANILAFSTALFFKLLFDRSLEVTVEGETDAPTGTTVNITYKNDLVLSVKVLKD